MKCFLSIFLFIGGLFISCSNDDSENRDDDSEKGNIIFNISLNKGITLRSGMFYSQEGLLKATRLKLCVFKKTDNGDYIFEKQFEYSWIPGETTNTFTIKTTGDNPLLSGDYKFLAIALLPKPESGEYATISLSKGNTKFEDAAAIINYDDRDDLFAGTAQAVISSVEKNNVSINLTRKMAGLLMYLGNVPTQIEDKQVKALRVTISDCNLILNLISGQGSELGAGSDALLVFEYDLSEMSSENGFYIGDQTLPAEIKKLGNSFLNGQYFMPIDGVTIAVQLQTAIGTGSSKIIKQWLVKDTQGNTSINLQGNSLYTIGQKKQTDSTEDDRFFDMDKNSEFVITISEDWDVIQELPMQ